MIAAMAATDYGLMIGIMIMAIFLASFISADPDLLQDVCVADLSSGTYILYVLLHTYIHELDQYERHIYFVVQVPLVLSSMFNCLSMYCYLLGFLQQCIFLWNYLQYFMFIFELWLIEILGQIVDAQEKVGWDLEKSKSLYCTYLLVVVGL